ncbi:hypothetical protein niasHS_000947 [Heterodera schachtii]|uniref:Uncharacterized protein n=1 Tax=Heterodera schachtii TaxID=97005 RepID=A0ABD2K865_HETSC
MFKFRAVLSDLSLCCSSSLLQIHRQFVTAPILRKYPSSTKQFANAHRYISRTRSLFMFIHDNEMEQWAEKMIDHKLKENGLDSADVCFSDLVHWWYSNVYESTLNVHGLRLLVKIALDKEQSRQFVRKRSAIAELWDYVKDTMPASDFLAFLVMEMVEREQLDEAKTFTKLLSIRGSSFAQPLRLLVWRASASENLAGNLRQNMDENSAQTLLIFALQLSQAQRVIEQLSAIVQECYFDVQHAKVTRKGRRGRRKKAEEEMNLEELVEEQEEEEEQVKDTTLIASSRYQSLLWLWMPNRVTRCLAQRNGAIAWRPPMRKQRNSSRQIHRMNAKDMAQLGQMLVKSWAEITTKKGDAKAWDRLMDFAEHNDLPFDEKLCKRFTLRRTSSTMIY